MKYALWWNEEEYCYTCVTADVPDESWLLEGSVLKTTFDADSIQDALKLRDAFIEKDNR